MLVRNQRLMGRHVPVGLHLSLADYVSKASPDLWDSKRWPWELPDGVYSSILKKYRNLDAVQHAVTLGISCEACHLGAKAHAEKKLKRPRFFPSSPDLAIQTVDGQMDFGRTHANVNWACGRCHAGHRPQFAGGMSTWNSTEYTDAMRGGCYTKLTCIECHNPHETIGLKWSQTPSQDDATCLKCHQE